MDKTVKSNLSLNIQCNYKYSLQEVYVDEEIHVLNIDGDLLNLQIFLKP